MAIRYDPALQKEIRRTVSNFNQKIARLERLQNNLYLPTPISIKELKSGVTNRIQLKRKLASLKRFSKRGAEKTIITPGGVSISKYEFEETERNLRRIKSSLTRQINKYGNIRPTVFGVPQSATYSQMGSQQLANLKARRMALDIPSLKNLGKDQFKEITRVIEANLRKERYRKEVFMYNYEDKMLFNLGYYIGYDKDKIAYIKNKLMLLDEKEFVNLFNTEKSIQAIADYYPESTRAYANPQNIKAEVSELYDELYNNIDSIIADYMK